MNRHTRRSSLQGSYRHTTTDLTHSYSLSKAPSPSLNSAKSTAGRLTPTGNGNLIRRIGYLDLCVGFYLLGPCGVFGGSKSALAGSSHQWASLPSVCSSEKSEGPWPDKCVPKRIGPALVEGVQNVRASGNPVDDFRDGLEVLDSACEKAGVSFVPLIAETCRWVDPRTFQRLPVWY